MNTDELEKRIAHMLAAIDQCLGNKYTLPALILIYSTIDIMAWLNRDEDHDDVMRSDFLSWVDCFLMPDSGLSCTSTDLYAARCSLLHSYTAESKLSREGKASQIFYVWGAAQDQDLQEIIDRVNTRNAKAVHVDKLLAALKLGIGRFLAVVKHAELTQNRAEKFFTNMPPIKLAGSADRLRFFGRAVAPNHALHMDARLRRFP